MPDLIIRESEMLQLDALIKKVPTEWGFGLVVYFQNINAKRQQEAQEAKTEQARLEAESKKGQESSSDPKSEAPEGSDIPF